MLLGVADGVSATVVESCNQALESRKPRHVVEALVNYIDDTTAGRE
jgi:hypothetical protein